MLSSLFFVVADFVEFALVLHLHQHNEKHAAKEKAIRKWRKKVVNTKNGVENESTVDYNIDKPKFDIVKIDRVAFVVFGMSFVLFNLIYWIAFLNFNFT